MTDKNNLTQNQRERLAILYCAALERGDLETVGKILEQACVDAELEQIILDIGEELLGENEQAEIEAIVLKSTGTRVRELAELNIPSGVLEIDEAEQSLPPLTIRTILAHVQGDASVKSAVRREVADAQHRLPSGDVTLPADLSASDSVEKFLQSLGLRLSEAAMKFVRRTTRFMAMMREEHETRLAATRRQRTGGSKKTKTRKNKD